MNASLIMTSIASPTEAMKLHAMECKSRGIEFIVIGDERSPTDFQLDGCRFVSLDEQKTLPLRLVRLLPTNHYSRKNIGYLLSRHQDILVETDDDNLPQKDFWFRRDSQVKARLVKNHGWFNVYHCFTKENIWPRGFPLELIRQPDKASLNPAQVVTPIQQGLADGNPDVDAVFRMTQPLPLNFEKGEPVALGEGCWCPFNSQNTTWFREAFLFMYLPTGCNFRMTDIWRSFVAQRIAWTCGWSVLFHQATVNQVRNVHSLHDDFTDELPGYLHNARLCHQLEELDLASGAANIAENLLRCYRLLTGRGFLEKEELKRVDAWIEDMNSPTL